MLKVCHCGRIACTDHVVDRNRGRPARQRCRDTAWRKLRTACLQRDGYACTQCGERNGLAAHHLTPGVDELHALTTLCRACHKAEHAGSFGTLATNKNAPAPR